MEWRERITTSEGLGIRTIERGLGPLLLMMLLLLLTTFSRCRPPDLYDFLVAPSTLSPTFFLTQNVCCFVFLHWLGALMTYTSTPKDHYNSIKRISHN